MGYFDAVEKEFGEISILVNNAGITRMALLIYGQSSEAWDEVHPSTLGLLSVYLEALLSP